MASLPEGQEELVAYAKGFRLETPVTLLVPDLANIAGQLRTPSSTYSIEHSRERWYKDFFVGGEHTLYVGKHTEHGPLVLALRREKVLAPAGSTTSDTEQLRSIIMTKKGSFYCTVPYHCQKSKDVSLFARIAHASGFEDTTTLDNLAQVKIKDRLASELLQMESMDRPDRLIIGVVYGCGTQSTLEQMYTNENGSPAFDAFLEGLGTKVDLRSVNDDELLRFAGFASRAAVADLPEPVYVYITTYASYEIIFHVSTLLPYDPKDPQKLARKRKIGNDISVLVFNESQNLFTPSIDSSKVTHVIAVLKVGPPHQGLTRYSFVVAAKDDVPTFGPMIKSAEFNDPRSLRNFLLAKLINGVHAAFHHAPGFRREDTLRQLLDDIVNRYSTSSKSWFGFGKGQHNRQRSVVLAQEDSRGTCFTCKKPVSGPNAVSAMGRTFHVDHFVCTHCQKPFGNEPFIVHPKTNQPYCDTDFTAMFCPHCEKCKGELDLYIRALGKTWHIAHFCCTECDEPIGEDPFFEHDGKPYCSRDYYKLFGLTCSKCNEPISDSCVDFMGLKYHPGCHICARCSQSITGPCVVAFDKPFHHECFRCPKCPNPFAAGISYFEFENEPYCEKHYHELNGLLCVACGEPIKDGCMSRMLDRVYHANHFKCLKCNAIIGNDDQYAVMDEQPMCMTCVDQEFGDARNS